MFIADSTSLIEPFHVDLDLVEGVMHSPENVIERHASDMRGYYADDDALERLIDERNDPLHYQVFQMPVPLEEGHLMYCISTLNPGTVGDECFMTKGHFHDKVQTGEIYLALRGEGYMLMKTEDGRWRTEKMLRGRMVYVPPYWAHRSVNTSENEQLISFCVYPAECGYNYGDIKTAGFPRRIFRENGDIDIRAS